MSRSTKSLISLLLLASLTLAVSGCAKKPQVPVGNQNQPVNTNQPATSTSNIAEDEIDPATGQKIHKNEKYGFEFQYPVNWYLDDCYKEYGFDATLVMLSDVEILCKGNSNDAKISILATNNKYYGNWQSRLKNYKEEKILVNNRESQRISGDLAYEDAEGNVIPNVWVKIIDTYIPINNQESYLVLRFHSIYKPQNMEVLEKNLEIYSNFVESFRFLNQN